MRILYLPNQYSQQRQKEKPAWVYPVRMAMEAEWHRLNWHDVDWGEKRGDYDIIITASENLPFLELPAPDRIWTRAFDKKYQKYGNYKYHPATHMQVADGCWHGKCTFCVENQKKYEVRDLYPVIEELIYCKAAGFKEVFDDSGTFPVGKWLHNFCVLAKATFQGELTLGCNMRIGANVDFKLMRTAGFRMLLFGIESANQGTLDRINKGINYQDIIPTIKAAASAGLEPHVAIMLGYPWETIEEEQNTINLVHYLLKKGYAKTAQASVYDVTGETARPTNPSVIYEVAKYPEFWINKLRDIKNLPDFLYLLKSIKKGIIRD